MNAPRQSQLPGLGIQTTTTRRARPADRERIATLWQECFGDPSEVFLDVAEQGDDHEHAHCNRVYVAVSHPDNRIVGFAIAQLCTREYVEHVLGIDDVDLGTDVALPFERSESIGYFHTLAVDPAHRNRGVGSLLVRRRLEWMRSEGATAAVGVSWLRDDHADSSLLFEKFRFEELAHIDEYYRRCGQSDDNDGRTACPDCGEGVLCECDAKFYARRLYAMPEDR